MCEVIRHRGPDDQGTVIKGPAALGMRRLSIIDLSGGHQPMSGEDGSVTIVFNGEIYKYLELEPLLEARGHRFRSRSDTEAIVHAYEEYGSAVWSCSEECLFSRSGMTRSKDFSLRVIETVKSRSITV